MNVVALMNQQTTKVESKNLNSDTKGQSPFSNLLKSLENKMTDSLRESQSQSIIREKLSSGKQSTDTESLLKKLITGNQPIIKLLLQQLEVNQDTDSFTAQENQEVLTIISELSSLLTRYATDNQKTDNINNTLSNKALIFNRLFQSENHTLPDVDAEMLSNQLKQVITQISSDQTEHNSEEKTIQLLEQWISLAEKSNLPEESNRIKKLVSHLAVASDIKEQISNDKWINETAPLDHTPLVEPLTYEKTREAEEIVGLKEQIDKLITQVSVIQPENSSSVKVMELLEQLGELIDITPLETKVSKNEKSIMSVDINSIKQILSQVSHELEMEQNIPGNKYIKQLESLESLFQTELKTIRNKQVSRLSEIENLWKEISHVLEGSGQLENDSNVKVLKLLEQWSTLEKVAPKEATNLLTQKQNTPEGQLWSRLLQTYQKRVDGQIQSKYQSSAMVTTTDVSKWIKNAVARITSESDQAKTARFAENLHSGQSISKLEQFVVYMKPTATSDQKAMENQLMDQFQKVIKSSKFMTGPNGSNQLLLKLNPDQLGDISVKLTQLNGEMIVKITATTQAAKEALESNLQQLRHMFSPQQVVVEKQDLQTFTQAQEEWNDSFDDQMSQSSKQENGQEQEQDDADQEKQGLSFEQVLMNERV